MKYDIGDTAINYIEYGKRAVCPLIFIHGFPFSHKMWEPQLRSLPDGVYAVVYDIRGHGDSGLGDGQYTIDLFADDLAALMDHLNISKAIICGLSMGGYIALRALEKYPDKVSGLILCDTKTESDSDEAKIKRASTINSIKSLGVDNFADDFVKSVFWHKSFERIPETVLNIKNIIKANQSLGICGTQIALAARSDTTAVLSKITIPTCIIVGQYDQLTPPSMAQIMHRSIPGSEFHVLSNAAHMSNIENAEDFNKALFNFIGKYWQY
jgi:3-oxoadipate enol-lactonase